MAKKLLLCVSAFSMTAAVWTGRRIASCSAFEDDDAGQAAFQTFIRSAPGAPVYLMADTVDEDYRFETLPHAFGSDRREMVERKLKQLYRSTPFYGANLLERDGDKRRDDRYLLAALTNGEAFTPWLQLLVAAQAPIAGVYPLPMVSLALIKRLGLSEPNLLVVSKHTAGIRQTFLKDQRFRISRLTPVRFGDQRQESYAEEIRNTRMYLDALNVTHVDDVVTIAVLDHDGSLGGLGEAVIAGRRNMRWVRVGPEDLISKSGIDRGSLEANEDALHLHLLGLQVPKFNLAPPSLTAGYTRYQASRALYAATALATVAGLIWCGVNFYRATDIQRDRQGTLSQVQEQQRLYQEITRTFPPAPTSSDKLKQTVETAERIQALSRLPDAAFRAVGQALEINPGITLNGLTWRHGRIGELVPNAPPPLLSQTAILQVQLQAMPGDFKGALAGINKFVKDLTKLDPVAQARTVKLPVNLASNATLSGSTSTPRKEQPVTAQFEVEVVLKPGV